MGIYSTSCGTDTTRTFKRQGGKYEYWAQYHHYLQKIIILHL